MAYHALGQLGFGAMLASLAYALFGVLFILFTNDWADQAVDALRRRVISQSSPKTIADGVLSARTVKALGLVSVGVALASAGVASWLRADTRVWWLGLFGISLFAVYSLPPLRINDRGGGELLEAVGVALVLPIFAIASQADYPGLLLILQQPLNWAFLLGFFLLALAGAIASGLGDEHSDRLGGKRTWVVLVGNLHARRSIEALVLAAAVFWFVSAFAFRWQFMLIALVSFAAFLSLVRRSANAARHDAPGLASYKDALRSGLTRSIALYAAILLIVPIFET